MKDQNEHKDNQKKSIAIALVLYLTIVAIMFFIRFWPPYGKTEALIAQGGGGGGATVNFGDSDLGKGDDYLSETLEVKMQETSKATPEENVPDEILTQDNVGAEVKTPPKTNITTKNKPKDTKPVENTTPVKKTNSALTNMLKGKNKGGDGDDNVGGNKGKSNGDLNSNSYYGNGGSGGGGGATVNFGDSDLGKVKEIVNSIKAIGDANYNNITLIRSHKPESMQNEIDILLCEKLSTFMVSENDTWHNAILSIRDNNTDDKTKLKITSILVKRLEDVTPKG